MPEFLEVLDAGLLTTVQDLGRPGHAALGVPRSGALDAPALQLANRLVGNAPGTAGLEITLTGFRARLHSSARVSIAGAPCAVRVGGREVPFGTSVSVPAGSELALGAPYTGARSYLAVAGGIDVEPVLGSRSTDLLSGLGPEPLRTGDRIPLGTPLGGPDGSWSVPPAPGRVLRLRLGPRDDWFTRASLEALDGSSYEVGADSNRIGLRLRGQPLTRSRAGELPSEGIVLGAVQAPPSGELVVFLHDHPTTGGYPVVGVVEAADLVACAQARPGDRLSLRVVA